ncbi:hypothetical protein [Streptomyces sp. NPDC059378]|uniref:hypothetical protein n=1 Tax=Streptomyces sp. NPDC059378 TaxID=3346815 RepID=UPI0036C33379
MATVSLTGASKQDTAAVFGVLRTAFATDRSSGDLLEEQPGGHSVVWSAESGPSQEWIPTDPIPLEGSVAAMLQGAQVAVDQLRGALCVAFAVDERGTASGDQEQEGDLRLTTKR